MSIRKLGNMWAVYWSDTGLLFFCFETWNEALRAALVAARLERK